METKIDSAIRKVYEKIAKQNLESLAISDYNKKYLKEYVNNYAFLMPLYKQLLQKAILKLNKPVEEIVFVDYGGGCGILSFLAAELGCKTVIYNDIYSVSTEDAELISETLGYSIQHFVTGDIEEFSRYLEANRISIDLCCSFNVLEHIYNLEKWFDTFKKIKGSFRLCFMTSANGSNPYINYKHKKIHYNAEFIGRKKSKGWKERDEYLAFLELRKQIISQHFPQIDNDQVVLLAKKTRGLYRPDIIKVIQEYLETGVFAYSMKHKTNTCDPNTGNWAEHIIDIKALKSKLEGEEFRVKFTNSYYSYSKNKLFNFPKYILNRIIRFLGEETLLLSPTYTLEIDVKN